MKTIALTAAALALSAAIALPVASQSARVRAPAPITAAPAAEWEIGPIIRGRNYSVGMPLNPTPLRTGWFFDFPVGSEAAGHVHYLTFQPGSVAGRSRITVRYRVDAAPGTRFVPRANPELPGTVSLYFQRQGDDWRARRGSQFFRWYAPEATMRVLAPGVHEMSVRLDDPEWLAVLGSASPALWDMRAEAWANIDRIGLVFGAREGRGHGVFASAPARFTLLSFRIE